MLGEAHDAPDDRACCTDARFAVRPSSLDVPRAPRSRRGVYLLPSMFTMANMFCGYACIVHAMRGEFATAAPFIGFAFVLDMLDGRIARMTGTTSAFGIEFDSLADVDLVRRRAGDPVVPVGPAAARSHRMGGGIPLRGGRGRAPGALQHPVGHRRTSATSSACRARRRRASRRPRCSPTRRDSRDTTHAVAGAGDGDRARRCLMVSTIRFRSFKTLDLQARRSYPRCCSCSHSVSRCSRRRRGILLVAMAYTYLASGVHRSARGRGFDVSHGSEDENAGGQDLTRGRYATGSAISTVVPSSRSLVHRRSCRRSTRRCASRSAGPVPFRLAFVEK